MDGTSYNIVNYFVIASLYMCKNCVFGNDEQAYFKKVNDYGVYYAFEEIERAFSSEEAALQNVGRLFNMYRERCLEPKRITRPAYAHPFIVVEGVHRTTRNIIGTKIARRINGQVISNPPKYMTVTNVGEPSGPVFRKAFFSLGVYGTACEARDAVTRSPVIVNGHWLFQASFAISKSFGLNIPPNTSAIYQWPKDLFKPDLIFFVNTPSPELVTTVFNDFRPVLINTFRQWNDPKVIELNTTKNYEELTNIAIRVINQKLNKDYNK